MEIVDSNSHQVDWFEKINVWECVVHCFWVGNIIKEACMRRKYICWFETGNRKSDSNQIWYKCEDKHQAMCFWKRNIIGSTGGEKMKNDLWFEEGNTKCD